jgi:ceramide glucosyltransferase
LLEVAIVRILEWIVLIPVLGGAVFSLLSLRAVLRFRRQQSPAEHATARTWPPVTILKPVCGLEKNLRENLRTACLQDYPEYQVVFSVQTPKDPALPLLEELEREFGAGRVSVAVAGGVTLPNGKIQNLLGALPLAKHDMLIISDSDVALEPDYVKTIVAPLADPTVGFVCTLYRAVDAGTWFEKMELLTFNADFIPSAVFAQMSGVADCCLGASLAFRRADLHEMGGLQSLSDYLVEDYEMGQRLLKGGKRSVVLPHVVRLTVDFNSPSQWWKHQNYWDQNSRFATPLRYFGTIVIRSVPFALLFALLRLGDPVGLAVLGGAVAVRLAATAATMRWGFQDREGLRSLLWLPLRDVAALVSWALAYTKRTTTWRGAEFAVTPDGRLVAKELACPESSSPATTSASPFQ